MTTRDAFAILRKYYKENYLNGDYFESSNGRALENLLKTHVLSEESERLLDELLWTNNKDLKRAIITILKECKPEPMSLRKANKVLKKYYKEFIELKEDMYYRKRKNDFLYYFKYKKVTKELYIYLKDLSWVANKELKEAITIILKEAVLL